MLINYLLIGVTGFLLSLSFIFLFKKLAFRYHLFIYQGIPFVGGMAIGLSFVLTCLFVFLLYGSLPKEIIGIIVASLLMLIFGIIDDLWELSIIAKFLVQIIATSLLILFGVKTQIVYIGNLLNAIITFIWVLGIANAFNLLDIMDGLSGSIAIIISSSFFAISILNADTKTAILTLALTSSIISFIIYNLPPAKIYIGNSGSHFLGLVLAAIALVVSYAPLERKIALVSPLLILGFPIFDTAFLILMRIKKEKPIFKKSNDHLALRLLKIGYSKNKTLVFMLLLCLFFSLCGIFVSQASNLLGIITIIMIVLVSSVLTKKMGKIVIDD